MSFLPDGKGGFAGMNRPGLKTKQRGIGGAIARAYDATFGRNTAKTISAQKEMAEYEWKKNLEMWALGNQYNSPEAQMERLRQAGLNPNLVYGSGTAAGNTSGTLPKYNAPNLQYDYPAIGAGVGSILGAYQDFTMKQAQTNNLEEQNKVIKSNAEFLDDTLYARTEMEWEKYYPLKATKEAELRLKQQALEQKGKLFPHQLDYAKGKIKQQDIDRQKATKAMKKTDQEIDLLKKNNEWYLTKMWSQIINQGLGTVSKFIPRLSGGKARIQGSPMGNSRAPWNTTLKTNPRRAHPRSRSGRTGKPNGD